MEKTLPRKEAMNASKTLVLLGPLLFAGHLTFMLLSDIAYPISTRVSDNLNTISIKMKNAVVRGLK